MKDVIINFPTDGEFPQGLFDRVVEGLRACGLKDNVKIMFYGETTPRTPPRLSVLYSRPIYKTIDPPEIALHEKLLRVKSIALEDISTDRGESNRVASSIPLVARRFQVSTKAGGEAEVTEFTVDGIVYENVTKKGGPSDRPNDDIGLLPWTIEVNGVVFQRVVNEKGRKE